MGIDFVRWGGEMGQGEEVEREGDTERGIGCLPSTPRPGSKATTVWCTG